MQKFDGSEPLGTASGFYETYKGSTQMGLLSSEMSLSWMEYENPIVLIALNRIARTGYVAPFVAICNKDGKIIDKGSMLCA